MPDTVSAEFVTSGDCCGLAVIAEALVLVLRLTRKLSYRKLATYMYVVYRGIST